MSRGIGVTQRRILVELDKTDEPALTILQLSESAGVSPRQIRTAIHSLELRGLVVVTHEHLRWEGRGRYGSLRRRKKWGDDVDRAPDLVAEPGDDWPPRPGEYVAAIRTEFVLDGMPVHGLRVWLPERRKQWKQERTKRINELLAAFGLPPRQENDDDA